MKVLFIGGTGLISTAVSKLAVERNIDLYVMNRGNNNALLPKEVNQMVCDINDEPRVKEVLKGIHFDAVVDWIAFTKNHIERDYRLFKDITKQYVFISSASAYQKPLPKLPITEDIPLDNPYWGYSQNKKHCETYLQNLNDPDFNVTIVRPSHTYGDQSIAFQVQLWDHPFTLLKQILDNKPIVLVGDGAMRWTLTYNQDFAQGFLDLLGNKQAYNDAFHLTSDKVYTWNELAGFVYKTLKKEPNIIYLSPDQIFTHFPELKGPILGDNLHDSVYDNTKIKAVAPNYTSKTEYYDILEKAIKYYLAHPEKQTVNQEFLNRYNKMIDECTIQNKKEE